MSDEGFEVTNDNTDKIIDEVHAKVGVILASIGIKVEAYAKARCPVGTPESTGIKGYRGGTLRNSITHEVNGDMLVVGSNVHYAPYVELGTGPYFDAPPAWEEFTSPKGAGISHGYVRPRPFLRPAIIDHISEYEKIAENGFK